MLIVFTCNSQTDYLDPHDLLSLAQVCRALARSSRRDIFWRSFLPKDVVELKDRLGNPQLSGALFCRTWKDVYRTALRVSVMNCDAAKSESTAHSRAYCILMCTAIHPWYLKKMLADDKWARLLLISYASYMDDAGYFASISLVD